MSTTITFPSVNLVEDASCKVYLKDTWAGEWTEQPKLHCRRLTLAAGPGISSAEFHWRIGYHLWPQGRKWEAASVFSVNPRTYVKVDVSGAGGRDGYTWYGVWHSARMMPTTQTFRAVGVESLLDTPCLDAAYKDKAISAPAWPSFTGRGLIFNKDGKANRSVGRTTMDGVGCHTFSNEDAAEHWSTRTAVEYLLAMAAVYKADATAVFTWSTSGLDNLPDFDQPVLPTHGRSYLSLLNSLVTRFRLIGWTCEETTIKFFTFSDAEISLTNKLGQTVGTIPANSSQVVFDISKDQSASATLATEAAHVCDVVKVRGERRKSVYSIRKLGNGTADAKWTEAQETAYAAGASGEADYPPATEPRLREERDREVRASDSLLPVFSWIGPDTESWSQKSGDCEPRTTTATVPIAQNDDGSQFWVFQGELELLPELPLLTNYEYDGHTIKNNELARKVGHRGNKTGDAPFEPLPLQGFIIVEHADEAFWGADIWAPIDQIGAVADLEPMLGAYRDVETGDTNARSWSASVRAVRGQPVAEVRVHGEVQHVIAQLATADFGGHATLANVPGSLSWWEMILTVCSYDTRDVEVQWPTFGAINTVGEIVKTLRIEAPGHELIYVVPGTVVRVDEKQKLVKSTGGFLQDDRDQMQVIAQRAYEWHKTPRYALGFSSGWIDGAAEIGQLVTSYVDVTGTYTVGSVLTELTLDFPVSESAEPQRPSASYVTAFGELDPVKVV